MSVRRTIVLTGLIFSLASLAFSFGSWSAQRAMAKQIADNDARLAALHDEFSRGTGGQKQPDVVAASGEQASPQIGRAHV